jgi:hypothetical protein
MYIPTVGSIAKVKALAELQQDHVGNGSRF